MTDWLYEDRVYVPMNPNPYEGFIYLIENLVSGKLYVGKKHFWTRQKDKKTGKKKKKESDWRNYYSSCDELKADVVSLGKENFRRTILHLCIYAKQMSFLEQKEQWNRNVLLEDNYYNTNIGGKFFVREKYIFESREKQVTTKNEKWREIKSEMMSGASNPAKSVSARKKISEKKSGKNHHQYGKQISESHEKILHQAALKAVKRQVIDAQSKVYESVKDYGSKNGLKSKDVYKLIKNGEIKYLDGKPSRKRNITTVNTNHLNHEWTITLPTGESVKIKGLRKFCIENNLGYSGMYKAYQLQKSYRGYLVHKT